MLFEIPTDRIKGEALQCCVVARRRQGGSRRLQAGPRMERLYVLSGCADVSRRAVEELLRPLEMMQVGERVGVAAAAEAEKIAVAGRCHSRRPEAANP